MIEPLISVIIPVYKVERYLDRCVQSVLMQTYKNIEIILVDDGSPDSCGAKCDRYATEHKNVFCIHKPNGGLSSARNVGMQNAHGDYIGFIDSDDWIADDMYEYLIDIAQKNNAEASQIAYKFAYSENESISQPEENIKTYNGKDILQYYMTSTTSGPGNYTVWRCLFKKEVLENIFFREGKINEDIDFKYKALAQCKRFVVSNQIKYFYYKSIGSTTTSSLRKRDFQLYEAADALAVLTANETYGTIAKLGRVKQARTAFSLLSKIVYFGYSEEIDNPCEIEKKLVAEHKKNVRILMSAPIPISRKILAVLFAVYFPLAKMFFSFFKKLKALRT